MKQLRFKKKPFFFVTGLLLLLSFLSYSTNLVRVYQTLPHISIRALEVLNDSTSWFAANHGVWGFTDDDGKTFHIDSLKTDSVYPEFRSIAVLNDSTVLLLSIGSPAYLYKTSNKGKTWRLVYINQQKDIFFDSMKFKNSKEGIAVGDPIEGCIQIIKTMDGGDTWNQINCEAIPKALDGEACFAASNTCISFFKNNVWFATGGKHARVFSSTDSGAHFKAYNTPLVQGETMTGIYSICFINEKEGVIAGGNYDKTDSSIVAVATTGDGGKTWRQLKTETPFFGSCVRIMETKNKTLKLMVTGHDGTFECLSNGKQLHEIKNVSGEKLKFHTFCYSKQNNTIIWLAGSKGQIAHLVMEH